MAQLNIDGKEVTVKPGHHNYLLLIKQTDSDGKQQSILLTMDRVETILLATALKESTVNRKA